MLALYYDDMSSNPADDTNFSVKLYLKRTKINKKRPGLAFFITFVIMGPSYGFGTYCCGKTRKLNLN